MFTVIVYNNAFDTAGMIFKSADTFAGLNVPLTNGFVGGSGE